MKRAEINKAIKNTKAFADAKADTDTQNTKQSDMKVRCKHTNLVFEVKRVRNSGKVELLNGVVIPENEFKLNWEIVK